MLRRKGIPRERGWLAESMVRTWGVAGLVGACALLASCEGDGLYELPTEPGPGPGPGPVQPTTGRGNLVTIPGVGVLADLVVDPGTGTTPARVFVSNLGQHRVEVLRLDNLEFVAPISVGSQPWGLSMNWNRDAGRSGDTLIVANSGGTNISFVSTANLREDLERRFDIPRITLYEVDTEQRPVTTPTGGTRTETFYTDIRFFNYADRPQHVVQDSRGRLVYSAVSTPAAPIGSARVADWQPGWREWEPRFFFHERSLVAADSAIAIANADSVFLGVQTGVIFDHVPGSVPRQHLVSPPLPLPEAAAWLRQRGSDVEVIVGAAWRLPESIGLADTTYVAASGDRRFAVIGEGSRTRASRIIMWGAEAGNQSIVESIADIVNNTSDFVHGVELNANGSLGVARGSNATYFFGNDLRLQGLTPAGGGGGAGCSVSSHGEHQPYLRLRANQRAHVARPGDDTLQGGRHDRAPGGDHRPLPGRRAPSGRLALPAKPGAGTGRLHRRDRLRHHRAAAASGTGRPSRRHHPLIDAHLLAF